MGLTNGELTENGIFHGGETWSIIVTTFDPPADIDWRVHDDGYGAPPVVDAEGTVTISLIGEQRLAKYWNVRDLSGGVVLENQSIVSVTIDVPDEIENVSIKIQLWDWSPSDNRLCDISGDKSRSDIELNYSIKTGHWSGDDYINDPSGYGRLNGCDDGSIFTRQKDCELWVNSYQTDPDGDGIPSWWEWKYGYDPFKKDSHSFLDPDQDGLNNYEEYLVSAWDSDPFRQDIFIELDQMIAGPNGEPASILPSGSKELLNTVTIRVGDSRKLRKG